MREIKILKALSVAGHDRNCKHAGANNIVKLIDVVSSHDHEEGVEGSVFMVFEFCDHDLTGLLEAKVPLPESQVKYYMSGILNALDWCHRNGILHRDIKGE